MAFRFITANPHPEHDTRSTFRRRFAQEFEDTFVPVLPVARENPLSRFGTVSLDGTKIHANASRHSALSYGHAEAMEAQLAARAAQEANGRKPGGNPPKAPTPGPRPNDQINLTDAESRLMPIAGGAFAPSYNAQAVVDTETMLVRVPQVTQAANDKQQLTPMLERLGALPPDLPQPEKLTADAGYFSDANVSAGEAAGIEPSIAIKRDEHHPHGSERFENPEAPPVDATPV